MKRLSLITLVLALVVLLAFPALVAAANGPAPKATGGCTSVVSTGELLGTRTLLFSAQGTLTAAKGHVSFSLSWPPSGFRNYEGEVTGYWQQGNRAAFRGVITTQTGYSSGSDGPATHFVLRIEDNGQGPGAEPDRFMAFYGWTMAEDTFLTDWEADPWPFSVWSVPVVSGNLVVH